jgi:hypothetical protein
MQKLQDTIDTPFADINPKPRPIAPSDTAVLRDRRLAEVASKIQKLKEARLQARSRQ